MKKLVAYFSAEGTTAGIAKAFAEDTGSDLFEIRPEKPYSAQDIRWTNPLARCNREKFAGAEVPVAGTVEGWDRYDTVVLGFPIWYYGAPNVVRTFCSGYDWTGKNVVLFATSGGSGIGKTAEKLKPYLKGNPKILAAEVIRSAEELGRLARQADAEGAGQGP